MLEFTQKYTYIYMREQQRNAKQVGMDILFEVYEYPRVAVILPNVNENNCFRWEIKRM